MRHFKIILALLLCLALPAMVGASTKETAFSDRFNSTDTGDATGPAATYLAFGGAVGFSGSTPVLDLVECTSDLATARFFLLTENGDSTTTDAAYSSGGKILPVTATTSFEADTAGAGSWIVIINPSTQKFEINRVSSLTAGASLNLVRNTANTYVSGTTVKELTVLNSVLVANTTKDFWGGFNGVKGKVLGWYLDGTSACRIGNVSGHYEK